MFISSFLIPPYERISSRSYTFDKYKTECYRTLLFSILSDDRIKTLDINIDKKNMNTFLYNISRYITYISVHSNSRNEHIIHITHIDIFNDSYKCITKHIDTFVKIYKNFIFTNLYSNSIHTELWTSPNIHEIRFNLHHEDIIIPFIIINNIADVLEETFNSHLQETINNIYNENNNHEIVYLQSTHESKENVDCLLCYNNASYVCSKCQYPLCDECISHIKHSTGNCPCCRDYVLKLKLIKILNDSNE